MGKEEADKYLFLVDLSDQLSISLLSRHVIVLEDVSFFMKAIIF